MEPGQDLRRRFAEIRTREPGSSREEEGVPGPEEDSGEKPHSGGHRTPSLQLGGQRRRWELVSAYPLRLALPPGRGGGEWEGGIKYRFKKKKGLDPGAAEVHAVLTVCGHLQENRAGECAHANTVFIPPGAPEPPAGRGVSPHKHSLTFRPGC